VTLPGSRLVPAGVRESPSVLGLVLAVLVAGLGATRAAAEDQAGSREPRFDNGRLAVWVVSRTPMQVVSFYEARGFPKPAVQRLEAECFLTFRVLNRSQGVIWLDLDRWAFASADGPVARLSRAYWRALWKQIALPLANRSTFRWTLLPEKLDLQPSEGEGGNVVLKRTSKPFELDATFDVGAARGGGSIRVRLRDLRCAADAGP
jgi:hypothetical protein